MITNEDGTDQHFDTIEEFERAMLFMSRLSGSKPPQDLIDEVKHKYEPVNYSEIDGEETVGIEKLEESLDELSNSLNDLEDTLSEQQEHLASKKGYEYSQCNEGKESGSARKVAALRDGLDVTEGKVYEVESEPNYGGGDFVRIVDDVGDGHDLILGIEAEFVDDDEGVTEYYAGDIVYVTDTIENPDSKYNVHKGLAEIKNGSVFENSLICQEGVAINFKTDNIDHRDKVRLVCRAEDRKDKDYGNK